MRSKEDILKELEGLCGVMDNYLVVPRTAYGEDTGDFVTKANCMFLQEDDSLPIKFLCNSDDVCYIAIDKNRVTDDRGTRKLLSYIDDILENDAIDELLPEELERDAVEEAFFDEYRNLLGNYGILWLEAYNYYMEHFHDWKTRHCSVSIPRESLNKTVRALSK